MERRDLRRDEMNFARELFCRWAWRLLVLEALLWLAVIAPSLRLVPFRRLAVLLGPAHSSSLDGDGRRGGGALPSRSARVGRAVARASVLAPFPARCLAQAMAAKAMLAVRGEATVLHLSVRLPGCGAGGDDSAAHAWLVGGGAVIIGGGLPPGHGEVARFGRTDGGVRSRR